MELAVNKNKMSRLEHWRQLPACHKGGLRYVPECSHFQTCPIFDHSMTPRTFHGDIYLEWFKNYHRDSTGNHTIPPKSRDRWKFDNK